jgi:hypothetical protein
MCLIPIAAENIIMNSKIKLKYIFIQLVNNKTKVRIISFLSFISAKRAKMAKAIYINEIAYCPVEKSVF